MIPYSKKLAGILMVSGILVLPVLAQENLLNYENSLKFARYLSNTRNYTFAAEEYERLNFMWPGDSTIILELTQTYRLNKDCEQFPRMVEIISADNRLFTDMRYAEEYLRFCLSCKNTHPLYFRITPTLSTDEEAFYSLGYYWVNQQYDSAFIYNRMHADVLSASKPQLYNLTASYENQKFKKPALALALSMVLPGSGKAYSKRWGDAAISFLLVSTSSYAAYRAFNQKGIKSFNGWMFGGVAISFYASNLYGSFKAAVSHNQQIRTQYQKNAESIIYNSF